MFKLWSTVIKDIRILTRDKVGIALMFGMPILLVIIVTSIQNNTFQLIKKNKTTLLICNRDTGNLSREFINVADKTEMFKIVQLPKDQDEKQLTARMHTNDEELLAVIIPADFSEKINAKAKLVAGKAMNAFGLDGDTVIANADKAGGITLYYQPVVQESFRQAVHGALFGALQLVESKQILRTLYFSVSENALPAKLENELLNNKSVVNEVPVSLDEARSLPNATQHNVPAWTIFAMFFVVVSLSGSIVREKLSGGFIRLKTLPTPYFISLLSKQIVYLAVTVLQAAVVFAIGVWLFPLIGLPALNLPADKAALFFVTLICGWCAVSYAACIGVFARTQEQANGFGAVSVVILAAIGGLMVPAFAMPDSFKTIMKLSPLHWCLEAYYGLFLEGGKMKDILANIVPLIAITIFFQAMTVLGLKAKKLI